MSDFDAWGRAKFFVVLLIVIILALIIGNMMGRARREAEIEKQLADDRWRIEWVCALGDTLSSGNPKNEKETCIGRMIMEDWENGRD